MIWFLPPAFAGLAIWADQSEGSPREERFGFAPVAVAVAAPLVVVTAPAWTTVAAVAGISALTIGSAYAIQQTIRGQPVLPGVLWSGTAEVPVPMTLRIDKDIGEIVSLLKGIGIQIGKGCAWIVTPLGIAREFHKLAEKKALSKKDLVTVHGKTELKKLLATRFEEAVRQLSRGNRVLSRKLMESGNVVSLAVRWVGEAVVLIGMLMELFADFFTGTELVELYRELTTKASSCLDSWTSRSPGLVSRSVSALVWIFQRVFSMIRGLFFGMGKKTFFVMANFLTLLGHVFLVADEVIDDEAEKGTASREAIDTAPVWLLQLKTNGQLPEEFTDLSARTERVWFAPHETHKLLLEDTNSPGEHTTVSPGKEELTSVPLQRAWLSLQDASGGWGRLESLSRPGERVTLDLLGTGAPTTYFLRCEGRTCTVYEWTGEGKPRALSRGVVVDSDPPATNEWASWERGVGASRLDLVSGDRIIDPGSVPSGTYAFRMGDLEVSSVKFDAGAHYEVSVEGGRVKMTKRMSTQH